MPLSQPTTMVPMPQIQGTYALLDSGEGARIEQFGDYLLERPASLAIWQRRQKEVVSPDSQYVPSRGWQSTRKLPEQWPVIVDGITMLVRCQSNGQVGVFPEHATYLNEIRAAVSKRSGARVLNLFAYTGLATLATAGAGAEVTHLDLSKSANRWARDNALENGIETVRFITDDALTFLDREAKRGNRYDLVIADPPSFSRPTPRAQWQLTEVIVPLIEGILQVLADDGAMCVTSHSYELGSIVLQNLMLDSASTSLRFLESRQLVIPEREGKRAVPAGFLVWAEKIEIPLVAEGA